MSTEDQTTASSTADTPPARAQYEAPAVETLSGGDYMALLGSGPTCGTPTVDGPPFDSCDITA